MFPLTKESVDISFKKSALASKEIYVLSDPELLE
jgi:hypothetical protein